jgi:branched-chain amino acid transport system substrate-binding protein
MEVVSSSARKVMGLGRLLELVFRRIGGDRMRSPRRLIAILLAPVATLPLILVAASAQPAAAAPAPITIAFVTDLTGPGASENATAPAGFKARIALQNAQGGVNGHKIVPLVIDDQTSPTLIVTAVQNAISKGAFGIVSESPLFFEAAKYPQQAGVPVTGTYNDGPEWGQQPYTNMFASDLGSVDPKYPVNTLIAGFLKSHGGTVIGTYGYGVSPSSSRSAIGVRLACWTPPFPLGASTSPPRP